ncbi:hypothetical protein HDU77_007053 [Chytriomyces hyalinus]|nr:hypothetical protein HDU77_007053 [Chytriomyces hyalinus]
MKFKILFALAPLLASASSAASSRLASLRDISESCSPSGAIQDACCEYKTIEQVNWDIAPYLDELIQTSFFRYVKIDLNRGCNFWKEDHFCLQEGCAVEPADESEIPENLRTKSLSSVDYSLTQDAGFPFLNKRCHFNENDFCVIDEPHVLNDIPYVNLLKNPERFTGYAGDSAARVWDAVYKENCFDAGEGDNDDSMGLGDLLKGMQNANDAGDMCVEKRVFYRLISGLHSSISTHICDKYLDQKTGKWYRNLDCFKERLGLHPDRIQNMYFTYVVLLRAIAKLAPYLESTSWYSSSLDREKIHKLVNGIVTTTVSCPPTFDESIMFTDETAASLKKEFKNHFRNISLIMDCVGCEKCRLWGKLQVTGLGTALKILFSFDNDASKYRLTRTELVSLINGFSRISDSLRAVERFRARIQDQEDILLEVTASTSQQVASAVERTSTTPTAKVIQIDLSHMDFDDPKKIVKWSVGLVITVLGVVSIMYKGYQNHLGTYKVRESAREASDSSFANKEEPVDEPSEEHESTKTDKADGAKRASGLKKRGRKGKQA